MSRPTSLLKDATLYWVIRLYDSTGALVDADSTPTVAVRKNGASVGDSVTVTKRSATTGIYDCSYNPASEVEGDQFTLEETAVISSTTYSQSWAVRVFEAERGTDNATVTVTPMTASVAQRVNGTEIVAYLGDTSSIGPIAITDAGGNAVDLSGMTLRVVIESPTGEDRAVVENASITVSGDDNNQVTFSPPSSAVASFTNNDRWSLRDIDDGNRVLARGIWQVAKVALAD